MPDLSPVLLCPSGGLCQRNVKTWHTGTDKSTPLCKEQTQTQLYTCADRASGFWFPRQPGMLYETDRPKVCLVPQSLWSVSVVGQKYTLTGLTVLNLHNRREFVFLSKIESAPPPTTGIMLRVANHTLKIWNIMYNISVNYV